MSKFTASQLSVLAYANSFTLWHYQHDGDFKDVEAAGFFDMASDMVRKKDKIIVNCDQAPLLQEYVVTMNEGGKIEVAKL